MTLEGIFGVPLDVAATYIILFTIYGAVLEQSAAPGAFFIDWALAAMRPLALGRGARTHGDARRVSARHGLGQRRRDDGDARLGGLAAAAPRAAISAETAGAILSAAGIGALLSPPTLGAAAFLIAEFLQISYLQVLVMATIPTLLYYLSILLMIEADSRAASLGTAARLRCGRTSHADAWLTRIFALTSATGTTSPRSSRSPC